MTGPTMTPAEKTELDRLKRLATGEACIGIDGVQRSVQAERDLNKIAAQIFATPGGEQLLAWLKRITVNNVQGPAVSDAELRHIEGQRYVVALLQQRIQHGQRNAEPIRPRSRRARSGAVGNGGTP
jgi:hypothetical protein